MSMEYEKNVETILQRLTTAHDGFKARIRKNFFKKENNFFRNHIKYQRVLVAGSGLGHDTFELAKYNKRVIGYELLSPFVEVAEKICRKKGVKNVEFIQGNFLSFPYTDNFFGSAVLNMGTISDFKDKEEVIKELLRVAEVVYIDFYPPTEESLSKRQKMYEEVGWKNVRIEDKVVISDDGLYSVSISKEEMKKLAYSLNAGIKFHNLCDFAIMAEIK